MTGKFSNVTKRDGKNQEAQQTPTRVHTNLTNTTSTR